MIIRLLIAFILLTPLPATANNCTHDNNNFRCVEYVKNYDGDTITFNIPGIHPLFGKKISIRINGIDTPEIRTKNKCEKEKALQAKKIVKVIMENANRIDLKNVKRGKYFRIVADVIIDGQSIKNILIEKKIAIGYDGRKKNKINWCKF